MARICLTIRVVASSYVAPRLAGRTAKRRLDRANLSYLTAFTDRRAHEVAAPGCSRAARNAPFCSCDATHTSAWALAQKRSSAPGRGRPPTENRGARPGPARYAPLAGPIQNGARQERYAATFVIRSDTV